MSTDVPKDAPKLAVIMAGHGAFLATCGVYGAYAAGWAAKAMHSAYAGLGSGAALALCAGLTSAGTRKLYMIGVHVALLLQLTFTGVFAVQAFRSAGVPEKADRFPLFVLMGVGSAAALALMMKFKPKKEKK